MTTRTNAEVRATIEDLASVIGLNYNRTDTPDEIMFAIEEELMAQIDEAEENPKELSVLMGYYHRLDALETLLDELEEVESELETFNNLSFQKREEFEL